jgi:hypothetical protein
MIWLLTPSPVSMLSLFLSLPVCRRSSLLMREEGRGWRWGRSQILILLLFVQEKTCYVQGTQLSHTCMTQQASKLRRCKLLTATEWRRPQLSWRQLSLQVASAAGWRTLQ